MKSNMLAATMACAALAIAAPALAKPGGGGGGGGGHGPGAAGTQMHTQGWGQGQGPAHATPYARGRANANSVLVAPGTTVRTVHGPNYGRNVCPPGLAAKLNGCLPPGQARKMYDLGQRIPRGFGFYTPLTNIPLAYRDQIPLIYRNGNYDYIYRNHSIYVVDPTTRLVSDIIGLAF